MNDLLCEDIQNLKNKIASLEEYRRLKEVSSSMENDIEVIKLYQAKEKALLLYEDSLKHFSFDDDYVIKLRKELAKANEMLNVHPLVKEYNELFRYLRNIDHKIEEEIFLPFKKG